MKKFLLVLGLLIYTCLGVNASTMVYYQNTGVPLYVQRGAGPMVSTHAMSINPQLRASVYSNHPAPSYHNNYQRDRFAHTRDYNASHINPVNPINNSSNIVIGATSPAQAIMASDVPNSRFNKKAQPRVQKSYTRSGMVYYN